MNGMQIIDAAKEYIRALFAGDFSGHDAAHSLRVYQNAMQLAAAEPGCDRELVALAALMHDADDDKLFQTENNENARAFLEKQAVDAVRTERICEIINGVSFRKNRGKKPATIEGMIVQDADRLDAMGAIGIARTFAYGGAHGRSIADSLRHFDEKLLLLKDEMNTGAGKKMARERHAFMETFLDVIRKETEGEG